MGQYLSIVSEGIKVLSCSDCAKYVCNSMHVHSKCSDCCECDFETDEVHIEEDNHEVIHFK